jgi:pimeloyl-ACP methyl ester carboxylesterase
MMPEITVNGITLAYELFGKGPPVVWTPWGWSPRNDFSYLAAGRLSANYRVLLWDRRNSGASDIGIEDAPSDIHLQVDDLHHLLQALDMSPAYLAGKCSGQTLSLMMAHRYPEDVRGLILLGTPTDDVELYREPVADVWGSKLAAVAEEKGMQAVIAHSTEAWVRLVTGKAKPGDWDGFLKWVAVTISQNPSNRDRLLAMDPQAFAAIMRKWGNWYVAGPGHVHGLSYEYIRPITLPTLVAHGFDEVHPRHAAEKLYQQLPNAEWVEYSDRYTREEIDQAREEGTATQQVALSLPFIEEFLQRIESDYT